MCVSMEGLFVLLFSLSLEWNEFGIDGVISFDIPKVTSSLDLGIRHKFLPMVIRGLGSLLLLLFLCLEYENITSRNTLLLNSNKRNVQKREGGRHGYVAVSWSAGTLRIPCCLPPPKGLPPPPRPALLLNWRGHSQPCLMGSRVQ